MKPGAARQEIVKYQRTDRMQAYQRNRRQWLITKFAIIGLGILVIAGVGYYLVNSVRTSDANTMPKNVASYSYPQGQHDDKFNAWTENPPVGGFHNNAWQNCGYYAKPIGTGNGVHSMEHGAVWITYQPNLPQDQIDKLKKLAEGQDFILVSPFPGIPSPIVASAWNKQIMLKSADDQDLTRFINTFKNNAKYTPEFGARCSGGVSTTTG
ncbi:MAG: DUF3105 domain-containing protein [Thermomicrobiales bacterium]